MAQHILVAEDEPAIADTITYALRTEGFEVEWCATGEELLCLLARGPADLIVLDVGLPDCNGFELCKEIRKTSAIPIIFLTARTSEVDRVVGLEIGGDDYIAKPFSPRELAARVKAVLRRTPSGHGESKTARVNSPFFIDKERMKIWYFGTPLDLSRYEFRILEVLMRRPGHVYSREQLMEMIWEAPESSMDRTVDTHIKTARAKLRAIKPEFDPIQTHRGIGYSLRES
ncbi:MAG TPA: two-component system response regulator CreB [Candidatus Hydrogenedentes bacterium]|nr:two-component system response regulator CreB [Candidatus Hydrogenedentota bacterium]